MNDYLPRKKWERFRITSIKLEIEYNKEKQYIYVERE